MARPNRALYLLDILVASISLVIAGTACNWLGSKHAYGEHTRAQVAFAVACCLSLAAWAAAEVEAKVASLFARYALVSTEESSAPEPEKIGAAEEGAAQKAGEDGKGHGSTPKARDSSPMIAMPLQHAHQHTRAAAELAGLMAFLYLCDRTEIFARASKVYHPAHFWGLWALVCVAALCTVRKLESTKVMQREQTDEWKGWMQIMFLMYHYFEEKEVYNAIRVYIAAYVWMTGYGNFFLYSKGKAFTTKRTLQMLVRLNLLGCVVCITLNNEYLLYYICAMHTFFTVIVALVMYVRNQLNTSAMAVYSKIVFTLLFTLLIYDGPSFIFKAVFGTVPGVRPLFAFHDPLHPEFTDEMHEWHFRSGLDRFIWIVGMVQAFEVVRFEKLMQSVESLPSMAQRLAARLGLAVPALIALAWWWVNVFSLEKYTYNTKHPYTSFIPITCFLLLRNLLPELRQRYLWLFAYLGKFTLETYIFQFHLWMKTTGLNGSPKFLMEWVPGMYYGNFVVTTIAYLFLSVRMFHVTVAMKDVFVPEGTNADIAKRLGAVALFSFGCWLATFAIIQR